MTVTEITKDAVLELLASNKWAVVRGLEALYARQTQDEQSSQTTKHSNGRGFNGTDANILSSFANQIAGWRQEKAERGRTRYPFPLSPNQFALAQKKLRKYSGQLAQVANEKQEAQADAQARAERDQLCGSSPEGADYLSDSESEYYAEIQAERDAIMAVELQGQPEHEDADYDDILFDDED